MRIDGLGMEKRLNLGPRLRDASLPSCVVVADEVSVGELAVGVGQVAADVIFIKLSLSSSLTSEQNKLECFFSKPVADKYWTTLKKTFQVQTI